SKYSVLIFLSFMASKHSLHGLLPVLKKLLPHGQGSKSFSYMSLVLVLLSLVIHRDKNLVTCLSRYDRYTPRLGRRESELKNRSTLPPNLTLKNFEGIGLRKMNKANDSGLASYVAGQIDHTLSWKVKEYNKL
ncbi:unnamed protein product, partial [Thlaspi arvense]